MTQAMCHICRNAPSLLSLLRAVGDGATAGLVASRLGNRDARGNYANGSAFAHDLKRAAEAGLLERDGFPIRYSLTLAGRGRLGLLSDDPLRSA